MELKDPGRGQLLHQLEMDPGQWEDLKNFLYILLVSQNCQDSRGEPANLVDGLYAVAAAILTQTAVEAAQVQISPAEVWDQFEAARSSMGKPTSPDAPPPPEDTERF